MTIVENKLNDNAPIKTVEVIYFILIFIIKGGIFYFGGNLIQ